MKRFCGTIAAFGVIVSAAGPTLAAPSPNEHSFAILVYDAPNSCPLSSDLERAVAERLGYEPFHQGADKTIRVTVVPTRGGKRFRAHLDVRNNKTGAPQGERDLPEEVDCAELVRAAALMVALAIDPLAHGAPPDVAAPPSTQVAPAIAPPPAPAASAGPSVVAPRSPPKESPIRVYLQAGATFSVLRLPTPGMGVHVQVGAVFTSWSIALEGRAEFPFSSLDDSATRAGSVSASLVSLAAVPCLEGRYYFGCGILEAGALQGTGSDVKSPKRDTSPLIAAGVRAGLQLETDARFVFRVQAEALAPVTRTTLSLNGAPVWTTPTVGLGFGVAVGRRF